MSEEKPGFATRLAERKKAVAAKELEDEKQLAASQALEHKNEIDQLEDADMPDIDTLGKDSDYSVFMSSKVSNYLRNKALRKMFLLEGVAVLDGLNDYDEDYTKFEDLGNIIPYDLKQAIAKEKEKLKEKALKKFDNQQNESKEQSPQNTTETPEPDVANSGLDENKPDLEST